MMIYWNKIKFINAIQHLYFCLSYIQKQQCSCVLCSQGRKEKYIFLPYYITVQKLKILVAWTKRIYARQNIKTKCVKNIKNIKTLYFSYLASKKYLEKLSS